MKITEPATMLTDYLLSAVALGLGILLWVPEWQSTPVTFWAVGFYSISAAALTGGTFHGFANWLSGNTLQSLWNVTIYLIGLGSGMMIAGAGAVPLGWSDPETGWLLGGLAFSLLGLAVQQSGWQPHRHFNHNDISHLIQITALAFFYLGVSSVGSAD